MYRADGTKLRKLTHLSQENGVFATITEYIDGFHYLTTQGTPDNNVNPVYFAYEQEAFIEEMQLSPNETALRFFPTAEGFYDFENKEYIYQYKDHLGNVRLSYKDEGNQNPIVTDSNDFYPFGMSFVRNSEEDAHFGAGSYYNYKYNGKELQETGMYDYGWRQYMPDLGRWYGMDQLSEKFHFASPYAYVLNNPLSFIDPDGRDINPTADGWEFTGADMQLLFKYLQGGNNLQAMVSSLAATDNFANNFNDSGISSFWSSFNSSGGGGSGWSGVSVKNGYATYWTNGAPASNSNFNDIQDMQESIGHRFRLP